MSFESIAAALAFIVAVYALLIQTKKSQTAVSTILAILLLTCLTIFLITLGNFLSHIASAVLKYPLDFSAPFDQGALYGIGISLMPLAASLVILYLILGDVAINLYYRTDRWVLRNRAIDAFNRRFRKKYRDFTPLKLDVDRLKKIFTYFFYHQENDGWYFLNRAKEYDQSLSVLSNKGPREIHNQEVAALVVEFLQGHDDTFVEYVCCTRHPIEFVNDMIAVNARRHDIDLDASAAMLKQDNLRSRLILVDAHTPHFGFDEPVYFSRQSGKGLCQDNHSLGKVLSRRPHRISQGIWESCHIRPFDQWFRPANGSYHI